MANQLTRRLHLIAEAVPLSKSLGFSKSLAFSQVRENAGAR